MIFDERGLLDLIRDAVREVLREERAAVAPDGEYLTLARAAEVASVNEATVRRWIRDGKLRRCSAGRHVRILRADLDRFLRSEPSAAPANDLDDQADKIVARARKR